MRLIDADALYQETESVVQYVKDEIEKAKHNPNRYSPKYIEGGAMQIMGMAHIQQCILDAPTVEERKTGKWIYLDCTQAWLYKCDQCGRLSDFKDNFCPNCGADMKGEPETDES